MRVFISWSGERSRELARVLKGWLPDVIQAVDPWMSEIDIDKGTRWSTEVATHLEDASIGIICLTPENLAKPWINFEAGALSKSLDSAYVCPYLLDLSPGDVSGPLSQFQLTVSNHDDTLKLVKALNTTFGERALPEPQLERAFSRCWDELEGEIRRIRETEVSTATPRRSTEDVLEEVLVTVRAISRVVGQSVEPAGEKKARSAGPTDEDTELADEPKAGPLEGAGLPGKAAPPAKEDV